MPISLFCYALRCILVYATWTSIFCLSTLTFGQGSDDEREADLGTNSDHAASSSSGASTSERRCVQWADPISYDSPSSFGSKEKDAKNSPKGILRRRTSETQTGEEDALRNLLIQLNIYDDDIKAVLTQIPKKYINYITILFSQTVYLPNRREYLQKSAAFRLLAEVIKHDCPQYRKKLLGILLRIDLIQEQLKDNSDYFLRLADADIVKDLVGAGADIKDIAVNTLLYHSLSHGHFEKLKALIENGANAHISGYHHTLLGKALLQLDPSEVTTDESAIIEMLINAGVTLNEKDKDVLDNQMAGFPYKLKKEDLSDYLFLLLAAGYKMQPDNLMLELLRSAIQKSDRGVTSILMQMAANDEGKTTERMTQLLIGTISEISEVNLDTLLMLIEMGADVNGEAREEDEALPMTPLIMAQIVQKSVVFGAVEIILESIEKARDNDQEANSSINDSKKNLKEALKVIKNYSTIIQLLKERGAKKRPDLYRKRFENLTIEIKDPALRLLLLGRSNRPNQLKEGDSLFSRDTRIEDRYIVHYISQKNWEEAAKRFNNGRRLCASSDRYFVMDFFLDAITNDDLETIQQLIKLSIDINNRGSDNKIFPLYTAVLLRKTRIVELLLNTPTIEVNQKHIFYFEDKRYYEGPTTIESTALDLAIDKMMDEELLREERVEYLQIARLLYEKGGISLKYGKSCFRIILYAPTIDVDREIEQQESNDGQKYSSLDIAIAKLRDKKLPLQQRIEYLQIAHRLYEAGGRPIKYNEDTILEVLFSEMDASFFDIDEGFRGITDRSPAASSVPVEPPPPSNTSAPEAISHTLPAGSVDARGPLSLSLASAL